MTRAAGGERGDGLNVVGSGPPAGSSWTFARPERLVQCCWCGEPILPGDYAMVVVQDTAPQRRWWSHYDSRPCYGNGPRIPTPGEDMSNEARVDPDEFAHYLALARRNGWRVPDPEKDGIGPAAWLNYWQALRHQAATRSDARPVQPHIPGQRPPEDLFEKAERINRNRELWRGYLT